MSDARIASQIWHRHIKGVNIMTPTAIRYGFTNDKRVFEVSVGEDFDRRPMWAVSVLDIENDRIASDDGRLFNEGTTAQRRAAAAKYVEEITS